MISREECRNASLWFMSFWHEKGGGGDGGRGGATYFHWFLYQDKFWLGESIFWGFSNPFRFTGIITAKWTPIKYEWGICQIYDVFIKCTWPMNEYCLRSSVLSSINSVCSSDALWHKKILVNIGLGYAWHLWDGWQDGLCKNCVKKSKLVDLEISKIVYSYQLKIEGIYHIVLDGEITIFQVCPNYNTSLHTYVNACPKAVFNGLNWWLIIHALYNLFQIINGHLQDWNAESQFQFYLSLLRMVIMISKHWFR